MDDDFNTLFSAYQKKVKEADSDETKRPFTSTFEDVTELLTPWGGSGDVFKTSQHQSKKLERKTMRQFGNVSLLLRRVHSENPNHKEQTGMRLEIQSDVLREAFQEIAQKLPGLSLHQNPIIVKEPFAEIYYCKPRIDEAIQAATAPDLRSELELLTAFEKDYMSKNIADIKASLKEGNVKMDDLWALFPPGTFVILQNRSASADPLLWCGSVKRVKVEERGWAITVYYTGFDGKRFGKAEVSFDVEAFEGFKAITSLPVYPIDFHPQSTELRQHLVDRGRKYIQLCRGDRTLQTRPGHGSHRQYKGPFWRLGSAGRGNFYNAPSNEEDGRILADPEGLLIESPEYRESLALDADDDDSTGRPSRYRRMWLGEQEEKRKIALDVGIEERELTLDEFLTAPPTIAAYSLSSKSWGFAVVDNIETIEWREDVYEKLQMDPVQKEVVKGLVEGHHASKSDYDDFIPGKGKGLVFLLYGPPGCGKTMTAESVAETLHRPLYYISGGQLDQHAEETIKAVFRRVARWEAILLFDEADTFLAARSQQTSDQNRLTSILLRLLEYQSGISFLTTNRVGDFDLALFSRIHITIRFEQLQPLQRQAIWRDLAEQTPNNLAEEDFQGLSQIPLDGRAIKNVLRTASLNCKMRGRKIGGPNVVKLGLEDVKAVLRYAVGDPRNMELVKKVEEFYRERGR